MHLARRLFISLCLFASLGFAAGASAAPEVSAIAPAASAPAELLVAKAETAKPKPVKPKATRPKATPAKAAPVLPSPPIVVATPDLLVDMQTGNVLYESHAGAAWHPASLTKLMTAYVAFEAIRSGRASLETRVTMSRNGLNQAPSRSGLVLGESVSLRDALYILLVKSANDIAVAIAETLAGSTEQYATEMNAVAARMGMTGTHYVNVNGLPDDGQVTTARDIAVLSINMRRLFPEYDPIFRTHSVQLGKLSLKSNNELLGKFEGTTGMKTGYICASGLNTVVTVERNGRELLAVVLGRTSTRERDQRAAQLFLGGFANRFADIGKNVVTIVDDTTTPPTDMKPLLCGAKAKAYVAQQRAAHPEGLKGEPNYLTDKVTPLIYAATSSAPPPAAATVARAAANDNQPAEGDAATEDDTPAVMPLPRPRR